MFVLQQQQNLGRRFGTSKMQFVTVQNSYVVTQMAIECHFVRAAKDLASLPICTGLP